MVTTVCDILNDDVCGGEPARSRRIGSPPRYSTPLIAQMSPPCGRKRSNITHFPSGDQTGESIVTSESGNSSTSSGFPPLTGEAQSTLCPTTSIMRLRSGENDMCEPPIIVSEKGCGSPP